MWRFVKRGLGSCADPGNPGLSIALAHDDFRDDQYRIFGLIKRERSKENRASSSAMDIVMNIQAINVFAPPLASLFKAMCAFNDMGFVDSKSD